MAFERTAQIVGPVVGQLLFVLARVIARFSDHAPHTAEEKDQPFETAPFGIVGLETALALTVTGLVEPGHVTLVGLS